MQKLILGMGTAILFCGVSNIHAMDSKNDFIQSFFSKNNNKERFVVASEVLKESTRVVIGNVPNDICDIDALSDTNSEKRCVFKMTNTQGELLAFFEINNDTAVITAPRLDVSYEKDKGIQFEAQPITQTFSLNVNGNEQWSPDKIKIVINNNVVAFNGLAIISIEGKHAKIEGKHAKKKLLDSKKKYFITQK